MTVAVTGASGHVGANLVRALLEAGRDVRALVHEDDLGLEGLPVERVPGDVRDPTSLDRAFAGAEVVYHLAAIISITGDPRGRVRDVNVGGAANVVAACLKAGVRRLVHVSSVHALAQRPLEEPLDETRAPAGDDAPAYDRSKAAGEREVQAGVARGLDAVILNPSAILGPHDYRPSRMGQVLLDLARGSMPALVAGGFDWVDVRDVVASALRAECAARTGERYLLTGTWLPVRDLASLVAEVTGVRPPRFVSPMWLARAGAPFALAWSRATGRRPLYTPESLHALCANPRMCHDRAARELGHRPRPLRDTVADTLAWFASRGALAAR